jgi:hypothetical protein
VAGTSENAEVVCHWAGGQRSRHALVRSVRYTVQLSRHAELLDRIRGLHAQGLRVPAIACALQADGWRSAHGKSFTEGSVRALLTRMGILSNSPKRPSAVAVRAEDELTVAEVAARLNLPEATGLQLALQATPAGASGRGGLAHALARAPGGGGGAPPPADHGRSAPSQAGPTIMAGHRSQAGIRGSNLFWRGIMAKTR